MIIEPRIRGFICTAAHPQGCAAHVKSQIDAVLAQGPLKSGPLNVLVIGSSTGYGLASRIVCAFGAKAKTLGIAFEKEPSDKKTASPGWYNTRAFEKYAQTQGLYAKSLNGDAFSQAMKEEAIALIKKDMGKIDLVIYSVASPRRVHPATGEVLSSTLKPIGKAYSAKTVEPFKGEVKEVHIEPANEDEIRQTIAVMGGEDWIMWMKDLLEAGVLATGCKTVAYSYVGPSMTHPIYKDGTIGLAKEDLHNAVHTLNRLLLSVHGSAVIAVNKAIVTQASAAIPVVPLYISLLYKVMKEKGTHEGAIEQMIRLFRDKLYASDMPLDSQGYIRMDDWELDPGVQQAVRDLWPKVNTENIEAISDINGYRDDFEQLFGFKMPGIDYTADVSPLDIE
jgi:enoyl-[acyl-carrier protein] reductase/trans-2-enoyl-CoA reductase (NAD+)